MTAKIDPARIAAIGISNQRETFSVFAEDGTAFRPGMVWLDDRARAQQKSFGERFGAERIHAISGKPLDVIPVPLPHDLAGEHEPAILDRAARIAEVHAYLAFRLTGRWSTSIASADPTGTLDMRTRVWSAEILGAAKIDIAKMPRLVAPGTPTGEMTDAAADATGLRRGTP